MAEIKENLNHDDNEIDNIEKYVIASILNDVNVLETAITKLQSSDFSNMHHKMIFDAAIAIFNNSLPVNAISVTQYIKNNEMLSKSFFHYESVIQAINLEYTTSVDANFYIDIVKEAAIKRELNNFCNKLLNTPVDFTNFTDQVSEWQNQFIDIANSKKTDKMTKIGDAVLDYEKKLNNLMNKDHSILSGTDTGFQKINELTDGFQPGDLIILAARPGTGKTALALNFILNAANAIDRKKNPNDVVVMFSLEMGSDQLLQRMAASIAMVDITKLRHGNLLPPEEGSINSALENIKNLPILLHDSSDVSINDIQARLKQLKATNNIKLVVVDYLQLVKGGKGYGPNNRQQEISIISRTLKIIARSIEAPVIALAQLSRKIEERGKTASGENPKPLLSDLRESGSIEQDADLVTFLYQKFSEDQPLDDEEGENFKPKNQNVIEPTPIQFLIEKHRNGSTGAVDLKFIKNFGKFMPEDTYDDKK